MLTGAGFVQPPAVRPLGLEGMTVDPAPRRHSRLAFGGAEHERRQMDKQRIIDEIRRTAKANGGVALGWRRFEEETGIRYYDRYGQYWTRWGDAVREAGFQTESDVPGL